MFEKGHKKAGGRVKGKDNIRHGGRTKGTPNKTNAELKQWLNDFISSKTDVIEQQLALLPSDEQLEYLLNFIPKVLPYVLPKQQETTLNVGAETVENYISAQQKINELFK